MRPDSGHPIVTSVPLELLDTVSIFVHTLSKPNLCIAIIDLISARSHCTTRQNCYLFFGSKGFNHLVTQHHTSWMTTKQTETCLLSYMYLCTNPLFLTSAEITAEKKSSFWCVGQLLTMQGPGHSSGLYVQCHTTNCYAAQSQYYCFICTFSNNSVMSCDHFFWQICYSSSYQDSFCFPIM